jgi:hypothetical protein
MQKVVVRGHRKVSLEPKKSGREIGSYARRVAGNEALRVAFLVAF